MGTSKGYGGPSSGLVPSWVDDPVPGAMPTPESARVLPNQSATDVPSNFQSPNIEGGGSFSGARGNFSRFSRSGDRTALGRALSGYVRNGTGGARQAARRMGAARASGTQLLGFISDVQRLGATESLQRYLNLPNLADRPASDVFLALTEFICPPGGAVDEAIARQAMLEAIGDLAEADIGTFDTLTPDQLRDFFLDYVSRSIEGRIVADIGARGINLPDDVAAVENAQLQLHDFIRGCTRRALSGRIDGLENLNDQDVVRVINEIYEAAFDLIVVLGEGA